MTEQTAIATLQHSLGEARAAKRRIHGRLAELELESESLRAQLASFDLIIEQTELALRRALFPAEMAPERFAPPQRHAVDYPPAAPHPPADRYEPRPAPLRAQRFEEEVATHRLSEEADNIRFADFRIPQAATIVLREAGAPLHVSEIYRRMAEGGFEFRGQHQLITLAVSLSRSKRFRKVAPGTFELEPRYATGQVA